MSLRQNNNNHERGGARAKLLLAIAFLAALIFSGVKIIPVFVNSAELQDAMRQEARFNFNPNTGVSKSPDDIRADIAKKVQELGLPVKPDEIQVTRDGSKVSISADYTISFDLIIYQWRHHFHLQADNTSI